MDNDLKQHSTSVKNNQGIAVIMVTIVLMLLIVLSLGLLIASANAFKKGIDTTYTFEADYLARATAMDIAEQISTVDGVDINKLTYLNEKADILQIQYQSLLTSYGSSSVNINSNAFINHRDVAAYLNDFRGAILVSGYDLGYGRWKIVPELELDKNGNIADIRTFIVHVDIIKLSTGEVSALNDLGEDKIADYLFTDGVGIPLSTYSVTLARESGIDESEAAKNVQDLMSLYPIAITDGINNAANYQPPNASPGLYLFSSSVNYNPIFNMGTNWRYTQNYHANWNQFSYNHDSWQIGNAPFANNSYPRNTLINNNNELYIRKTFSLTSTNVSLFLEILYDENPRVYINGVEVFSEGPGRYISTPVTMRLNIDEGVLRTGDNIIAIATNNSHGFGGRVIDAGLGYSDTTLYTSINVRDSYATVNTNHNTQVIGRNSTWRYTTVTTTNHATMVVPRNSMWKYFITGSIDHTTVVVDRNSEWRYTTGTTTDHAPIVVPRNSVWNYMVVPSSQANTQVIARESYWKYSLTNHSGWMGKDYNDASWILDQAPIGTNTWSSNNTVIAPDGGAYQLYIRREFTMPDDVANLNAVRASIDIIFDEDPIIYINGTQVWNRGGWNGSYENIQFDIPSGILTTGRNVVAIYTRNVNGGGRIDISLNLLYTPIPPNLDGWNTRGYNDSAWKTGQGAIGTTGGTGINTNIGHNGYLYEAYMRREFTLPSNVQDIDSVRARLNIMHDDNYVVYINGVQIDIRSGARSSYLQVDLDIPSGTLVEGTNVLAIYYRNTGGPGHLDAELALLYSTVDASLLGWNTLGYNDSTWQSGQGAVGTQGASGVNSEVGPSGMLYEAFMRREFTLPSNVQNINAVRVRLSIRHDDNYVAYINGVQIHLRGGTSSSYINFDLDIPNGTLVSGTNILAIYYRNTGGPGYLDAELSLLYTTVTGGITSGWNTLGYDDSSWESGEAGIGTDDVNNKTFVGPNGMLYEAYMRKEFELPSNVQDLNAVSARLIIRHDDDCAVYLNGVLIHSRAGVTGSFTTYNLTLPSGTLKSDKNVLAIYYINTGGRGYLDAELLLIYTTVSGTYQGWNNLNYDDSAWQSDQGGIGTAGSDNRTVIGANGMLYELYMRQQFTLPDNIQDVDGVRVRLNIKHDDDCAVYLNGRLIHSRAGVTGNYTQYDITIPAGTLVTGSNVLAIYYINTGGLGYLDADLSLLYTTSVYNDYIGRLGFNGNIVVRANNPQPRIGAVTGSGSITLRNVYVTEGVWAYGDITINNTSNQDSATIIERIQEYEKAVSTNAQGVINYDQKGNIIYEFKKKGTLNAAIMSYGGSILIDGTRTSNRSIQVKGDIVATGDITIKNAYISGNVVSQMGNVIVEDSYISGQAVAQYGSVTITSSTVTNVLATYGSVTLNENNVILGSAKAYSDILINNSNGSVTSVGVSIECNGNLTLESANIVGDLSKIVVLGSINGNINNGTGIIIGTGSNIVDVYAGRNISIESGSATHSLYATIYVDPEGKSSNAYVTKIPANAYIYSLIAFGIDYSDVNDNTEIGKLEVTVPLGNSANYLDLKNSKIGTLLSQQRVITSGGVRVNDFYNDVYLSNGSIDRIQANNVYLNNIKMETPGTGGGSAPSETISVIKTDVLFDYGSTWKYAQNLTGGSWMLSSYDDSSWLTGIGGFGDGDDSRSEVGTRIETNSGRLYIRKNFNIASLNNINLYLKIAYDENPIVYINGVQVYSASGWNYERNNPIKISAAPLVIGNNVIAIETFNTAGGRYVDASLYCTYSTTTESAGELFPLQSSWKYTMTTYSNWNALSYNDTAWSSGQGGFGDGADVNTPISRDYKGNLYLRKTFELDSAQNVDLILNIQYDDNPRVYINGTLVFSVGGSNAAPVKVKLAVPAGLLVSGTNVIAISNNNPHGRRFLDAGLAYSYNTSMGMGYINAGVDNSANITIDGGSSIYANLYGRDIRIYNARIHACSNAYVIGSITMTAAANSGAVLPPKNGVSGWGPNIFIANSENVYIDPSVPYGSSESLTDIDYGDEYYVVSTPINGDFSHAGNVIVQATISGNVSVTGNLLIHAPVSTNKSSSSAVAQGSAFGVYASGKVVISASDIGTGFIGAAGSGFTLYAGGGLSVEGVSAANQFAINGNVKVGGDSGVPLNYLTIKGSLTYEGGHLQLENSTIQGDLFVGNTLTNKRGKLTGNNINITGETSIYSLPESVNVINNSETNTIGGVSSSNSSLTINGGRINGNTIYSKDDLTISNVFSTVVPYFDVYSKGNIVINNVSSVRRVVSEKNIEVKDNVTILWELSAINITLNGEGIRIGVNQSVSGSDPSYNKIVAKETFTVGTNVVICYAGVHARVIVGDIGKLTNYMSGTYIDPVLGSPVNKINSNLRVSGTYTITQSLDANIQFDDGGTLIVIGTKNNRVTITGSIKVENIYLYHANIGTPLQYDSNVGSSSNRITAAGRTSLYVGNDMHSYGSSIYSNVYVKNKLVSEGALSREASEAYPENRYFGELYVVNNTLFLGWNQLFNNAYFGSNLYVNTTADGNVNMNYTNKYGLEADTSNWNDRFTVYVAENYVDRGESFIHAKMYVGANFDNYYRIRLQAQMYVGNNLSLVNTLPSLDVDNCIIIVKNRANLVKSSGDMAPLNAHIIANTINLNLFKVRSVQAQNFTWTNSYVVSDIDVNCDLNLGSGSSSSNPLIYYSCDVFDCNDVFCNHPRAGDIKARNITIGNNVYVGRRLTAVGNLVVGNNVTFRSGNNIKYGANVLVNGNCDLGREVSFFNGELRVTGYLKFDVGLKALAVEVGGSCAGKFDYNLIKSDGFPVDNSGNYSPSSSNRSSIVTSLEVGGRLILIGYNTMMHRRYNAIGIYNMDEGKSITVDGNDNTLDSPYRPGSSTTIRQHLENGMVFDGKQFRFNMTPNTKNYSGGNISYNTIMVHMWFCINMRMVGNTYWYNSVGHVPKRPDPNNNQDNLHPRFYSYYYFTVASNNQPIRLDMFMSRIGAGKENIDNPSSYSYNWPGERHQDYLEGNHGMEGVIVEGTAYMTNSQFYCNLYIWKAIHLYWNGVGDKNRFGSRLKTDNNPTNHTWVKVLFWWVKNSDDNGYAVIGPGYTRERDCYCDQAKRGDCDIVCGPAQYSYGVDRSLNDFRNIWYSGGDHRRGPRVFYTNESAYSELKNKFIAGRTMGGFAAGPSATNISVRNLVTYSAAMVNSVDKILFDKAGAVSMADVINYTPTPIQDDYVNITNPPFTAPSSPILSIASINRDSVNMPKIDYSTTAINQVIRSPGTILQPFKFKNPLSINPALNKMLSEGDGITRIGGTYIVSESGTLPYTVLGANGNHAIGNGSVQLLFATGGEDMHIFLSPQANFSLRGNNSEIRVLGTGRVFFYIRPGNEVDFRNVRSIGSVSDSCDAGHAASHANSICTRTATHNRLGANGTYAFPQLYFVGIGFENNFTQTNLTFENCRIDAFMYFANCKNMRVRIYATNSNNLHTFAGAVIANDIQFTTNSGSQPYTFYAKSATITDVSYGIVSGINPIEPPDGTEQTVGTGALNRWSIVAVS